MYNQIAWFSSLFLTYSSWSRDFKVERYRSNLCVMLKQVFFSYLLKQGTNWNYMKPPENSWNHLKPQVDKNGQIWSQKLKLSKLTKIWYRGTLLYPYFEFNIYFFKIFIIHIFWGANLFRKSQVLHVKWNLVRGYIAICSLRF